MKARPERGRRRSNVRWREPRVEAADTSSGDRKSSYVLIRLLTPDTPALIVNGTRANKFDFIVDPAFRVVLMER